MGFDCSDIPRIVVYLRSGGKVELSHEESVELCREMQETGDTLESIYERRTGMKVKALRLMD
ncbi:hypothetical protein GCM10007108_11530 [Thermogymnomonas acidicola]|uniref:Uncharacterized protein n=1 Tax=Thermogymnomonas acidicola TaxID=399579 RepID=A0AA37F9S0_9ARCH|nr:hypothetical protein [Thermogymnomonas acidicola]GGM75289.1 hypothetical protein GCM10007108_11530 [Thermogymnomonas acidicola]